MLIYHLFVVLETEPRASDVPGECHTTELRAQSEPKLFPEDVISLCAVEQLG